MKILLKKIGLALAFVITLIVFLYVVMIALFWRTFVFYENAASQEFSMTRDLDAPGLQRFFVDDVHVYVLVYPRVSGPGGRPYTLVVGAVSRSPGAAFSVERVEFRDLLLEIPAQSDGERVAINGELSKGHRASPQFSASWTSRDVLDGSMLAEIAKKNGGLDATVWVKVFKDGKVVDGKIEVHFDQRVFRGIVFPT